MPQSLTGIMLCMCPANERWCYNVTSSLIGWAHIQNDPRLNVLPILNTFSCPIPCPLPVLCNLVTDAPVSPLTIPLMNCSLLSYTLPPSCPLYPGDWCPVSPLTIPLMNCSLLSYTLSPSCPLYPGDWCPVTPHHPINELFPVILYPAPFLSPVPWWLMPLCHPSPPH